LGFRGRRPLLVFNGPLARVPGNDEADGAAGVHVARMEVRAALACFDVMHEVAPSWQRERPSLEHMAPQMEAFGAFADDGLRAYALVSRVPVGIAVLDVGTLGDSTQQRARYVEAVIAEVVAGRARQPVRVINVPPGDPLGDVLSGLGCPVVSQQWEMVLELDRPA
jgi:hypothetical protein